MRTQSSWHRLNADSGLAPHKRLIWLAYNALNNMRSNTDVDAELSIRRFPERGVDIPPLMRETASSPSRLLSDLFWHELPWSQLAHALGGQVRAVEFGCGSGRYGEVIREYLGPHFAAYTGMDLCPNPEWEDRGQQEGFSFLQGNSKDATPYLRDHNLILTQSALEHFDDDLTYARQVADWVLAEKRPVLQVHLMPSEACLWTYLWHGVRQYSPRTLSSMTRLYGQETEKVLFRLGGSKANAVHRQCYTKPMLLRKPMPEDAGRVLYHQARNRAVMQDANEEQGTEACFYALVLASWFDEPLFS